MIKVLADVDRKSGPEAVHVAVRENRFLLGPIDRNELCRATELSAGSVGQFHVDAGKFAVIVHENEGSKVRKTDPQPVGVLPGDCGGKGEERQTNGGQHCGSKA